MIAVVHLVWAPLGPRPLREFLRSYGAHSAGAEHELVILLNGADERRDDGASLREILLSELAGIEHRLIDLEQGMPDLAAYVEAARLLEARGCAF